MCLSPITAEKQDFGRPKFTPDGSLKLPCGKCTECKSQRAAEWAIRARHEISLHNENCFITLTYNDENLPSEILSKEPFQKFMKRLRKHTKTDVRYMVSHEYGEQYHRPHHHVILFGYNPPNQKFTRTSPSGEKLFISTELDKLWNHGFHSIGQANEKTAYYIASYSLAGKTHTIYHPETGEETILKDQFDCSRRPGIGLDYFKKNYQQLFDSGEHLPRYYIKKLETEYPELFEQIQNRNILKIKNRPPSETYAKYKIDNQKREIQSTEFRSTPEDKLKDLHEDHYLRTNRDTYVAITKGK